MFLLNKTELSHTKTMTTTVLQEAALNLSGNSDEQNNKDAIKEEDEVDDEEMIQVDDTNDTQTNSVKARHSIDAILGLNKPNLLRSQQQQQQQSQLLLASLFPLHHHHHQQQQQFNSLGIPLANLRHPPPPHPPPPPSLSTLPPPPLLKDGTAAFRFNDNKGEREFNFNITANLSNIELAGY